MKELDPPYLLKRLGHLARRPIWVAYSGGRDSHALLHLAVAAELSPQAVHIDHGLHEASSAWAEHCARVCAALGVALTTRRVQVERNGETGLEAAARDARYQAFADILPPEAVLLTAHHRDDQAETVLLRIMRGAGLQGLAGAPAQRRLGRGVLLRPLLDVPRACIDRYAEAANLQWLDDPSNTDPGMDRNFLRNIVLPSLQQRWPAATDMIARVADQAREDAMLLDELAALDLAECSDERTLSAAGLRRLSRPRQRNAVRLWFRRNGVRPPGAARLADGLDALLNAGEDREPVLRWADGTIRRYRDRLYLLPGTDTSPPAQSFAWDLHDVLAIPGLGRLSVGETNCGARLSAALRGRDDIRVRFRRGGERIRPVGAAHSRALKTLFQEAGIPPWERRRTPLIYVGGDLACVGDRWVAAEYAARGDEPGLRVRWLPA